MTLFERILAARGLYPGIKESFLSPDYAQNHDPFLLPDMGKAVERLVSALKKQEKITIYGDYDIDGLTASTLLLDALNSFGFKKVNVFIPNRFVEGYGLSIDAVKSIAKDKTDVIITVDCGSLSEKEIIKANKLGVDVIVTDHHGVASVQPPAIAVINPKRLDSKYPFSDLASVGVAFKLVQALQTKIDGLPLGQEKWLLDLVALGTVCDVVSLTDENRINVYWGLKVLQQTKRPGLKSLMAVAMVNQKNVNARSLGFALGPRMNAAGRLETAQYALDMLVADDALGALEKAQYLDELNKIRRIDQEKIFKDAIYQVEQYKNDSVLVLSGPDWNHGIVGIVAAKIMEKYKKPTIVLEILDDVAKGSARSFGDFDIADAIRCSKDIITSGGGHRFAAGVTLPTDNLPQFRDNINALYQSKHKLSDQQKLLLPRADTIASLVELTEEYIDLISQLEPFGHGNPEPILESRNLKVINVRKMGDNGQHIKLVLQDNDAIEMSFVAFNYPKEFYVEIGSVINVLYQPLINEWMGKRSIEGKLLSLEVVK